MKHNFLKKIAMIVLITFFSVIIKPDYSCSQSEPNHNEFDEAKKLYDQGEGDKALEKFNRFIDKYKEKKEIFRSQLSDAYFYVAKIRFYGENYGEMKKAFWNLFNINLNYSFPQEEDPNFIEKAIEIKKEFIMVVKPGNKKKFPWLLVAGVVVVGVVVAVLLKKKTTEKKFALTVNAGEGVEGNPASGTYSYNKDETVNYSYTLKGGYNVLSVKLDGNDVPFSGSIKMNQNHTLTASASKRYTLTVVKKNGVNGTPESGTYAYNEGETVTYNYSLQQGYKDLTVTIDGTSAAAAGTITMDRDHSLIASSGKTYSLTVTKGEGVNGFPPGGSYTYPSGETINYNYTLQNGYSNLVVTLDGTQIPASGTITMDKNHTLNVSATRQYTLTVSRGDGVNGTPATGTFTYNAGDTVTYNYTLQEGYQNLVVTLDGNPVNASGTFTMNAEHDLKASATPVSQFTLTVNRGTGVEGDPITGNFPYNEGTVINYNYTLQAGYTNLVVTLDGISVATSGTITMDRNHILNASATPTTDQFILTVEISDGVTGKPSAGSHKFDKDAKVDYEYSFTSGYTDLSVTLDGKMVSALGSFQMNANRTLVATAKKQYKLKVTKGEGVEGSPNGGEADYPDGFQQKYSYTLKAGYTDLTVTLDGKVVTPNGTITMDRDHTLISSATKAAGYDEKK